METDLSSNFTQSIADAFLAKEISPLISWLSAICITLVLFAIVVSILVYIRRRHLDNFFKKITGKTTFAWDDLLARHGCFTWAANIGFSVVFIVLSRFLFGELTLHGMPLGHVITTVCHLYFVATVLFFLDSALNAFLEYYSQLPVSQDIGIKGFIQAVKLIIFLVGLIFMMSILIGKSPVFFLSGIGALTAVLLLIFKDAILGFVAGIQISVNHMVKVGDWVEMPTHMADGDVIDISLTTVKIQNWDKTITSIPTYDLIAKPFKNWRGMQKSGGRRIKRSIFINMNTIKFADEAMVQEFKRISLIKPYVEAKLAEIDAFNQANNIEDRPRNGRSITNIGTFRAYCVAYLKAHPKIHDKMTFLIRQLAPTSKGLPLEIYVFSNDIVWANYESIQSDIFDHLLSILPVFELSVFQEPTGQDFASLKA
jgi:miniconductance mechanosensitive channel